MKTISKTEYNMTHTDDKKFENGQHYIIGYIFDNSGVTTRIIGREWMPVKIRGVKKGEKY